MAAPLVCALVLTGCSTGQDGGDRLQVVENPVAASPAASPAAGAAPAGTVLEQDGPATAVAVAPEHRILATALAEPPSVLLYDLDQLGAAPRRVELPGRVEQLSVAGGELLATVPGALARIALPGGTVRTEPVQGGPAAATTQGDRTLLALRQAKAVEVLGAGSPRTITGQLYSADDVLVADGQVLVLDRLRTALFDVDVEGGTVGEGLRAGDGATNAAVDGYGRVLVADTRGDALLAFSADPLLLRQRYPVPGGVYGIATDPERDLAWVTLTGRNEVVGYDIRGGEPREKYRFPTVRQPNSVAVDTRTGRVVVSSAAGEGTQVIQVNEP